MICDTENCNNEATHWDQVRNPICQACIDTAMTFDESVDNFTLIGDEPPIEDISDTIQIIKDATAAAKWHEKETWPDESTTETEIIESEHGANLGDASTSSTTSALTIFEETLTEDGLAVIKSQAANLPAIAKTEPDYDTVYEFSTRLKRLSVAVRKKEKTIQKDLKTDFTTRKLKISKDLDYVTGIITPLIDATITSRDFMESWIEARKEQKALIMAETATREQNRIHIFSVYDQAHQDNIDRDNEIKEAAEVEVERIKKEKLQDEEAERVKNDAAKLKAEEKQLKQDRYEFECEKTRLSEADAWEEAYPIKIYDELSEFTKDQADFLINQDDEEKATDEPGPFMSDSDIETLREFAKDEPVEPVEYDDITEKATAEDRITILEANEKIINNEPPYPDYPDSILYSTDPAQKEKQLLEQDEIKIRSVIIPVETVIDSLTITQQIGFESITATTATRRLIESIQAASDIFEHEVGLSKLAPELKSEPVDDTDAPF